MEAACNRLVPSVRLLTRRPSAVPLSCPNALALQPSRTRAFHWRDLLGRGKKEDEIPADRTITELLKQSPKTVDPAHQPIPTRGTLGKSSIFDEETSDTVPADVAVGDMELVLDPKHNTWKWLKREAARDHRRRGRLNREEKIKQTEKQHTVQSHFFKTSVKKLGPLARQISGKKIEDALIQMRFSPKKAAKDVLEHLEYTLNEAIVRRNMKTSETYISQAWVGRGPYGKAMDHRARGRINMLRLPHTCITVELKEMDTLRRIAREKDEKRIRKGPLQHLPSRPIYGQRQYYRW